MWSRRIEPDPMSQLLASAGGNPMDVMFDFLPEGKRSAVVKIMTDTQAKMIEAAQDGMTDPAQMLNMQREIERALQEVLSPEEFLDYQLRFSMTANMMRQQLAGFDPDEQEFLTVFHLREAFGQEGIRRETEQALGDVLGEDGWQQYNRRQNIWWLDNIHRGE
jgi:hypothetical protein